MFDSVFLVLMIMIIRGLNCDHNYIGLSETFHLHNVPDNIQICSPDNQAILTKTGDSCKSAWDRIDIQKCSKTVLVFILSDLRFEDSGVYHICQQNPTYKWSYFLDVQAYGVEVIANPQSSFVQDSDNVTLTCQHAVPPKILNDVQVKWIVTNPRYPFQKPYNWTTKSYVLTVSVSHTRDCDIYTCELYRNDVKISNNKHPFKINKVNKTEDIPKHVLYTGNTVTFIIPENVFVKHKFQTFSHSSGLCMYQINQDGRIEECSNLSEYIKHRYYYAEKKNYAIYITLEDLSPFDSGTYKLDNVWSESLLVWGYESTIESTPTKPIYGGNLTLICNHNFPDPTLNVDEYRWSKIIGTQTILLKNTEKTYSVGSPLTEEDQNGVFQCRPVYSIIGFSLSPRYTVQMFIPPQIKSFTINELAGIVMVNNTDEIQFNCDHISSVPVKIKYYLTHDPNSNAVPTVQLSSINATCDMDGVWTCHTYYDYGARDSKVVLEDQKNVTLVVNNCEAKIKTTGSQIKIPVKFGESTNLTIPFTGTGPEVVIGGFPIEIKRATSGSPLLSAAIEGRNVVVNIADVNNGIFNGNFTLDLSNDFSNDSRSIVLQPTGKPEPPSNLTVLDIGGDHVTIQWHPGFMGGANQSFIIEHMKPSSDWSVLDTLPSTGDVEQTYNHTSLFDPNTLYGYRVKGVNVEGESSYSNVLSLIVGTEILQRNITKSVPEPIWQDENTVIAICVTVGVVAIIVFVLIMVLIFTRRRNNKEERLLVVEDLHRASPSVSEVRTILRRRSSDLSTSVTGESVPAERTDSGATTGSSEGPYVDSETVNNTLPRLTSDYRSSQRSTRVRFQNN